MGDILKRAADPHQYDNPDLHWGNEGAEISPTRLEYWSYLRPYATSWNGKSVLDIGSGTGWLSHLAVQQGEAQRVVGIEPSSGNVATAMKLYPKTTFPQLAFKESTLQDYQTNEQFDVTLAIMSLIHIPNLEEALLKVKQILRPGGEFLAIVPDYEYFRRKRPPDEARYEQISEQEYTVAATGRYGVIASIVRTMEKYREAAERVGLVLEEDIPMPPSEELVELIPQYGAFVGKPITHLLRFKV